VLFDADDIDYLVTKFSIPELNKEIRNAQQKKLLAFDDHDLTLESFWNKYIDSCKLAINIQNSLEPITHNLNHGKTPFESIESIKSRYDIVEFIERYVTLKKSASRFVGLCPFHNDKKHPSFTVYPQDQTFHCFGCSTHGDLITFFMKYEHIDIKEALQRLSR
jgi:hypothetical protein